MIIAFKAKQMCANIVDTLCFISLFSPFKFLSFHICRNHVEILQRFEITFSCIGNQLYIPQTIQYLVCNFLHPIISFLERPERKGKRKGQFNASI